jgi:hypothetical protein
MLHWMKDSAAWALLGASLLGACSDPEAPCGAGTCPVGALADSRECPDGVCSRLEELSQGCLGAHTEQTCSVCGFELIRVGGIDDVERYYEPSGALAAVRRVDESTGACGGWYGGDLSDCVLSGDPLTVPCEDAPM